MSLKIFNSGTLTADPNQILPNSMHTTIAEGVLTNRPGAIINRMGGDPLSAFGYDSIESLSGVYNWDISKALTQIQMDKFPMLTIADLNSETIGMQEIVIGDEIADNTDYERAGFYDFRLIDKGTNTDPFAVGSVGEFGGKLEFNSTLGTSGVGTERDAILTWNNAGALTNADQVMVVNTIANEVATVSLPSDFDLSSGQQAIVVGWKARTTAGVSTFGGNTCRAHGIKMTAILSGNYYKHVGTTNALTIGGVKYHGYLYQSTVGAPAPQDVYAMFSNIAYNIDGVDYQEYSKIARIEAFYVAEDFSACMWVFNMSTAGLDRPFGSVNTFLLEEVRRSATVVGGGTTRLEDEVVLGRFYSVPTPIAEGSDMASKGAVTGFQKDAKYVENYCQIFQSMDVTVSGSRLANNMFRINDVQKNRERAIRDYKQQMANTFLWGAGYSKISTAGVGTRACSGLFHFEKFPIRYINSTLDLYSKSDKSQSIRAYMENISRALFAFRQMATDNNVTALCSRSFLEKISDLVVLSKQGANNLYGQLPNGAVANFDRKIDLGIKHYDFITSDGTIRFVHEPMLDYMSEFKLPRFMTADAAVNPKDIMIVLDKSLVKKMVYRGDTLMGNVQPVGADYTREFIKGEAGFKLLAPKNHAIIINKFA